MIKGECNCSSVSFEIDTLIPDVYLCHCSICRRSTGGTGIAVILVRNESFFWLTGMEHIKSWTKQKHDWQTSFCTICGSPVPGKNDNQNMYIPVSLLSADVENLKVAHHLFVGSKAIWEKICDDGMQHIGAYGK